MSWLENGWEIFPFEKSVIDWIKYAKPAAIIASKNKNHRSKWMRSNGTWFVGVDALPNNAKGIIKGSESLDCMALRQARNIAGSLPLHRGQVSVTYSGYPQKSSNESQSAFNFRLKRDSAHIDGLKPIGLTRRRFLIEPHAWILGLPIDENITGCSPTVVWEDSHKIIKRCLLSVFRGICPEDWHKVDLTKIYKEARKEVFEKCNRIELLANPGETFLIHRLTVHGIAPWINKSKSNKKRRILIYFRPKLRQISDWLFLP